MPCVPASLSAVDGAHVAAGTSVREARGAGDGRAADEPQAVPGASAAAIWTDARTPACLRACVPACLRACVLLPYVPMCVRAGILASCVLDAAPRSVRVKCCRWSVRPLHACYEPIKHAKQQRVAGGGWCLADHREVCHVAAASARWPSSRPRRTRSSPSSKRGRSATPTGSRSSSRQVSE